MPLVSDAINCLAHKVGADGRDSDIEKVSLQSVKAIEVALGLFSLGAIACLLFPLYLINSEFGHQSRRF